MLINRRIHDHRNNRLQISVLAYRSLIYSLTMQQLGPFPPRCSKKKLK